MSVALKSPLNLEIYRRPPAFFGTGKDPVWGTLAGLLGPSLTLHPDSATHGLVEPSITMSLKSHTELALAATQPCLDRSCAWKLKNMACVFQLAIECGDESVVATRMKSHFDKFPFVLENGVNGQFAVDTVDQDEK